MNTLEIILLVIGAIFSIASAVFIALVWNKLTAPTPAPGMAARPDALDLTILGQNFKIPTNAITVLWLLIIGSAVCIVAYFSLVIGKERNVSSVYGMIGGIFTHTGETQEEVARVFNFWTPSLRTREAFGATPEQQKANAAWKDFYEADDKKIEQFTNVLLTDLHIRGYSRFEVFGRSANPGSVEKWGYWWSISIFKDQDVTRRDVLDAYSKFWNRKEGIYLEEYSQAVPKKAESPNSK